MSTHSKFLVGLCFVLASLSAADEVSVIGNQAIFPDTIGDSATSVTYVGTTSDMVHPFVAFECCNLGRVDLVTDSADGAFIIRGAIGDDMPFTDFMPFLALELGKCISIGGTVNTLSGAVLLYPGSFNHWRIEVKGHAGSGGGPDLQIIYRCRGSFK